MSLLSLDVVIERDEEQVWKHLYDIASHTSWMRDAKEIRFTSAEHSGIGTTFDCVTQVGPLRTTDRMEITEWQEGRAIGVRHVGTVTGIGRFVIRSLAPDETEVTWTERLTFPKWSLPMLTSRVTRAVLHRVWTKNLQNLKQVVESETALVATTRPLKES